MLNTKSCWASALIWATVSVLVGSVVWHAAGWPVPATVWSSFLRSETAETLKQFQTLVAGIVGFGLASFAYWLNGSQNRQARVRHNDTQTRTLAHALMAETERLEADCDVASAHFASLADEAEKKRAGELVTLPGAHRAILRRNRSGGLMLTELDAGQLARLGTNACSALLMLRNAVADLDREAHELTRDGAAPGAGELKEVARAYSAVCLKCARVRPLLWTLARHGIEIADQREPAAMPSPADVERHLHSATTRSQQAASATILAGPGAGAASAH